MDSIKLNSVSFDCVTHNDGITVRCNKDENQIALFKFSWQDAHNLDEAEFLARLALLGDKQTIDKDMYHNKD